MKIDNQPYDYQPGGAYGQCVVCGFRCRLNDMRLRWDGARTCLADWDPRPVQLTPPVLFAEGVPRPDAQPAMPDVFVDFDLSPADL